MKAKKSKLDHYKLAILEKAIKETKGNISRACRILGISRDTAYRWINSSDKLQRLLDSYFED